MGIESTDSDPESVLDLDKERIVYEVGGSPRGYLEGLELCLGENGVEHFFDLNGDLVVYADDEKLVEELFESLPDADEVDDDDPDDLAAVVQMTAMWHAVGTLQENPDDADAVLAAAKTADALEKLKLPFGFEKPNWERIVAMSARLRDQLESNDDDAWDDDQIIEAAGDIRAKLQNYV